jgi:hypothetical protein
MADPDLAPDRAFSRLLSNRLTDLRLRADLGTLASAAEFRAALEQDSRFRVDDPRVRAACVNAGFGEWLG